MRFKNCLYLKDMVGEERVVRKFLLLPRSLNTGVTRWLEYAYIREVVKKREGGFEGYHVWYAWEEVEFADD